MANWLKIAAALFCLVLVLAFFSRKQGANPYDAVIMNEHALVVAKAAELHLSMAGLKEDSLNNESRQLGEEIKTTLERSDIHLSEADFDKVGTLTNNQVFLSSTLGIEEKYVNLTLQVKSSILILSRLEAFRDNILYRDSALAWMRWYQSLLPLSYRQLIDLFKIPTDRFEEFDLVTYRSIVTDLHQQSLEMDERFATARTAFARQFDADIEEK